ncbi:hypothetical protein B0H19DRAFT_1341368 [Mycena capillaripes]|nr:hypothetical protein B0H19DRAFT_1341368 [Mycena capillaripes]
MADPITVTMTVITFATIIKDLIEVGQSIRRSVEKVSENRRQIRDLANDILCTLANIGNLSRPHENAFQTPELLSALANLKADMLYVLSVCGKISTVESSHGLRGFRSQIKVWMKRDDVERAINRLKGHVNKCYLQFTAFSAARIEHTSLRVEHTSLRVEQRLIVNNVDNQLRLRRLEGMMARVLLETQFGQNVMNQTVEIIASTLELQYLSTQALRLMDTLKERVATRSVIFVSEAPLWDGTSLVFSPPPGSAKHILHKILGFAVKLNDCPTRITIPLGFIEDIMFTLGQDLEWHGMNSEGTACDLAITQILRLAGRTAQFGADILPYLILSYSNLSARYQHQLRWDLATQTSQQALYLCRWLCDMSPDADYWSLFALTSNTHSDNLRMTGQLEAAISLSQEAVMWCRPIIAQILEDVASGLSRWTAAEYKAARSVQTFLAFARALSQAVDQPLEAHQAWKEGFQAMLRLPGVGDPSTGRDIDLFVDQMCIAAEGGQFTLAMLSEVVILFRNLGRIWGEGYSQRFLWMLDAYAYYSQQDHPSSLQNLRLFLEPSRTSSPPTLVGWGTLKSNVDDFSAYGVIEDAVRAFYTRPWFGAPGFVVVRNIFITHFHQATVVLRDLVTSFLAGLPLINLENHLIGLFAGISHTILFVSPPQKRDLLGIMTEIVAHFRAIATAFPISSSSQTKRQLFTTSLDWYSWALWAVGLPGHALEVMEEAIQYLRARPSMVDVKHHADNLRYWALLRALIFYEMTRIPEAITAIQEAKAMSVIPLISGKENDYVLLLHLLIQIRILHRTGQDNLAFRFLQTETAVKRLEEEGVNWDDIGDFHFLLVDCAAVWRCHIGEARKTRQEAERALVACRQHVDRCADSHAIDKSNANQALTWSLISFSHSLEAVQMEHEALVAAKEAVSIYTLNVQNFYLHHNFACIIRPQELGANAFHSLSLCLATSGQLEEALSNAEKATELYRELTTLVPRHLPNLASSLQNLASLFWNSDRRDESVVACTEAVGILRRVSHNEDYFLPNLAQGLERLGRYLSEKGDAGGATAAIGECAGVSRKIRPLPHQMSFKEHQVLSDGEHEVWETAIESDDEYHDLFSDEELVVGDIL